MEKRQNTFDVLNMVDVNTHTKKKDKLTYLSWPWAWAEVKKRYPDAAYTVKHWDGRPYLEDERFGIMCETSVTIDGETLTMWLPVMNSANKALKSTPYEVKSFDRYTRKEKVTVIPAATMFDINKTIMRCLVKNLAMFGLGLYIYADEDLPEAVAVAQQAQAQQTLEEHAAALRMAKTLEELKTKWQCVPVEIRPQLQQVGAEVKKTLTNNN